MKNVSEDIFHELVYPEGGVTVLILALITMLFTIINIPLGLVIIDFESNPSNDNH